MINIFNSCRSELYVKRSISNIIHQAFLILLATASERHSRYSRLCSSKYIYQTAYRPVLVSYLRSSSVIMGSAVLESALLKTLASRYPKARDNIAFSSRRRAHNNSSFKRGLSCR